MSYPVKGQALLLLPRLGHLPVGHPRRLASALAISVYSNSSSVATVIYMAIIIIELTSMTPTSLVQPLHLLICGDDTSSGSRLWLRPEQGVHG